jgi:ATP-dependent RNA helicase DDX42
MMHVAGTVLLNHRLKIQDCFIGMKSRFAKPITKNSFNAVAPPTASRFSITPSSIPSSSSTAKSNRDYFDDEDDEIVTSSITTSLNEDDDDYDPLDAFMADNLQVVQKQNSSTTKHEPLPEIVSAQDIDDDFNEYYSSSKSKGGEKEGTSEDILDLDDYTEDDKNNKNKAIEPLAAVDHSKIAYAPFTKCFYKENAEISGMSESEVAQYREELEIHMNSYKELGRPIKTFKQAGFDPTMLKEIERAGYTAPTPIQAQTLPLALSGRDIIGLAKTGSGKTLAYVWPIIVHILNQPQMKLGDGPIALVLAPTRELASQIHVEAKKFAKIYNIRSVVVYGGAGQCFPL